MLSAQLAIFTALAALTPVHALGLLGIAPYMGTACQYIVFGTSQITTGESGHFDGHFGISPTTIEAVTIPPGLVPVPLSDSWTAHPQVFGSIYGPGANADSARQDFINAYNYAWSQPPTEGENTFSPVLSGQTFLPGVYRWSGNVALGASQTVTLTGALGSVFIFQSVSLTTGAFSKVKLQGGVTANSVFWVPSSTLGLGAFTQFAGISMTGTAVNVGASSTVDGSVFAQSAVNIGSGVVMTNDSGLCVAAGTSLTASGLSTKAKRAAKLAPRWDRDVVRSSKRSTKASKAHSNSRRAHVQHVKRN
ncbi:hypothetical protein RQP46_000167 [Phenoliferia psychrophenolica]